MEGLKRNMRHVLAIQHVENRMQNKLNACNIWRGKKNLGENTCHF